ncbi:hypothetical protein C0993_001064, partial [Termitomyces sp. T159_Od127]
KKFQIAWSIGDMCHDLLPTPRTQPQLQDSNPLKTTPMTALSSDRYLANSLSSPRQSPPIIAHQRHQPPPLAASLAITAMTATSAPVLAITLPIAATSAPAHAETPITDHNHASLLPDLRTPRLAPAPSSPPHHHVSLHFQCKTSTPRNMSQPCPTSCGPWVSPQAPVLWPTTGTWA